MVRNKVLYFPYIRVPDSTWFTRILLYWDNVGTIVPLHYIQDPESLGEYTRSLVESELVTQIFPGDYIYGIPNYAPSFATYINNLGIELENRRKKFEERDVFKIHAEKLGGIEYFLKDIGLASYFDGPWLTVERQTAKEFMSYLSGCLGRLPEINSVPVTDDEDNISVFFGLERAEFGDDTSLRNIRGDILARVFPAPSEMITPHQIETFKRRHGNRLRTFRRAVEDKVIEIAQIADPAHRRRKIDLFQDEISEVTEEIREYMNESGFVKVFLGKLLPVFEAYPGAPNLSGITKVINEAFFGPIRSEAISVVAYAAYANIELLQSKTG